MLEIQLFGGFSSRLNNQELVSLQAERLILLFSYLATHFDQPISRKQLASLFWPDSEEEQARTNLRNLLHLFRRALPDFDAFLEVSAQFIRWKADAALQLDVRQFRIALTAAKGAMDDATRVRHLREAVGAYRGELLPGFYEDWILIQREELHQAYANALIQLTKLLEDARQYADAIETVNRLQRVDPLNESAYLQSMRLHALNDDRAGALQVYHTCVTVLQRELGVEPSAEIQTFRETLLQSAEGSGESAREGRRLIGRKQEWGRLREAWQASQKGRAQMVAIMGEAGIGKTRLANELTQWTQRQGIRTAFAQCYPLEGNLPFAPVVTWLRAAGIREELETLEPLWKKEIARLLPELEESESVSGQKWQRQRLFEALARGLIGSGAARVLTLDDIQWSDQETLEFLHYLLRFDMAAKLLVVATVRLEEVNDQHPLNQLRNGLQARGQITEIELGPLNKDEVGLLASDLLGKDLSEENEARIFTETEGNPFFAVEVLRAGAYESSGSLPAGLRSVLTRRLNQLSPTARELVELASAIGREFDFSLLAAASQMEENALVQALDELWSRRIIQTQQGDMYNFSHGKLQDAAYETLSAIRRQIIHRQIAGALLARDAESALVASHFEKAVRYPQAMEHYLKASDDARRVFANQNAIALLEHALELMTGKIGVKSESQRQRACEAHELLGDLYDLSTNPQLAAQAYQSALELIPTEQTFARARVMGKLSKVISYELDYERGMHLFEDAVEALGERTTGNEAEWWKAWLKMHFDRAWIEYDRNRVDKLEPILESVRPVAERLGETDTLAEYYYLLPTLSFRRDGYMKDSSMLQTSELALELSRRGNNLELQTRANFGYGFIQALFGHFDKAIPYYEEGLRLARQIGYVEQEAYCVIYLAAAHRCAGHLEECKKYSDQGVALCEREGYKSFASTGYANLGWLAWKRNDLKEAKALSLKALDGWGPYYPFCWYGLWTLLDLSLLGLRTDDALDYARRLKAPGQQVFAKDGDDLLSSALAAAEVGDMKRAESLLMKSVEWAKKNAYL